MSRGIYLDYFHAVLCVIPTLQQCLVVQINSNTVNNVTKLTQQHAETNSY